MVERPFNRRAHQRFGEPECKGTIYFAVFFAFSKINAVRLQASLRIRFMQSTEEVTTTWETHYLNATNSPHVTFDYYTCDAHATCNKPQGLCACNEGYVGDGVTCAGASSIFPVFFPHVC